ncbi:MAG: hypothetical protein ACYC6T_07980 [Thermoleophilia bacterium]
MATKKKSEALLEKGPELLLVFTGETSGATRYTWAAGTKALERGSGVPVATCRRRGRLEPTEEHFAALFRAGDAVLEAQDS